MIQTETAKNLFTACNAAWGKYNRNCSKVAFMDATRRFPNPFEAYGPQLAEMKAAAIKARNEWTAAAASLTTAQIVEIVAAA